LQLGYFGQMRRIRIARVLAPLVYGSVRTERKRPHAVYQGEIVVFAVVLYRHPWSNRCVSPSYHMDKPQHHDASNGPVPEQRRSPVSWFVVMLKPWSLTIAPPWFASDIRLSAGDPIAVAI
jgi:hypothetical protein